MIMYLVVICLSLSLFASEQSTYFALHEKSKINIDVSDESTGIACLDAMAFFDNDSKIMIADSAKLTIIDIDGKKSGDDRLPFKIQQNAAIHAKTNKLAALLKRPYPNSYHFITFEPAIRKITSVYDVTWDGNLWSPLAWNSAGTAVVFANLVDGKQCPHIFDVSSQTVTRQLDNPDKHLAYCQFSPDGAYLAGATFDDKSVIIWNVKSGAIERKVSLSDLTLDVYWSPDQKWLMVSKFNGAALINVQDGAVHENITEKYINGKFGLFVDDARFIFCEKAHPRTLEMFNVDSGKKQDIWKCADDQFICNSVLSENGRTLAVALYNQLAGKIDTIKLFDVKR